MSGPYRTLRRPIGGWGAKLWRRQVFDWFAASCVVTGSWGALNLAVELLSTVAELTQSLR